MPLEKDFLDAPVVVRAEEMLAEAFNGMSNILLQAGVRRVKCLIHRSELTSLRFGQGVSPAPIAQKKMPPDVGPSEFHAMSRTTTGNADLPMSIAIRSLLAAMLIVAPALAQAQQGKLVVYTSQPNQDAQQTIDAFKAKHPKVDITFVRDGTPRIVAKLRAEIEAGQAQADVLLIADAVTMEDLKREGRLLAYPDADVAAYPAGMHDKDKAWFATKLITTGIIYNTRAPFQPQSWTDLVRPETKGQVVMPSPLASGAALIHAATLTSNLAEGWGFYEKLKANGAIAASGNGDVLKQVAGGEKLFGMVVDFMAIREKTQRRAGRVRVSEGRRVGDRRAGRDPEIDPESGRRARLRGIPAVARGPGARTQAGLRAGARRRSRCRRAFPRARTSS